MTQEEPSSTKSTAGVTDQTVQHSAFPQPADPHVTIWRYMDIAKFADIVTHRRLYMARADLLGDEHEGTTPVAELEYWHLLAENAQTDEQRRIIQGNRDQLSDFAREFRPTYYVSCWHMSPDENIAMWERYVKSNDAVAIRSTFSTLRSLLDRTVIQVGVVRYMDYGACRIPSFNLMELIMHKRHFFRDEQEVRAVVWSMAPEHIRREHVDPFLTADRAGFLAPINPKALIQSVVLHPKATPGAAAQTAELCRSCTLPQPVASRISSTPRF
jgi:hypothetical protein